MLRPAQRCPQFARSFCGVTTTPATGVSRFYRLRKPISVESDGGTKVISPEEHAVVEVVNGYSRSTDFPPKCGLYRTLSCSLTGIADRVGIIRRKELPEPVAEVLTSESRFGLGWLRFVRHGVLPDHRQVVMGSEVRLRGYVPPEIEIPNSAAASYIAASFRSDEGDDKEQEPPPEGSFCWPPTDGTIELLTWQIGQKVQVRVQSTFLTNFDAFATSDGVFRPLGEILKKVVEPRRWFWQDFMTGSVHGIEPNGEYLIARPFGAFPSKLINFDDVMIRNTQRWRETLQVSLVGCFLAGFYGIVTMMGPWSALPAAGVALLAWIASFGGREDTSEDSPELLRFKCNFIKWLSWFSFAFVIVTPASTFMWILFLTSPWNCVLGTAFACWLLSFDLFSNQYVNQDRRVYPSGLRSLAS
mmetsp:Transcript_13540/g.29315  ORF Transcript_13540/g.29315 Transcript_13540/m.29315 type:complete len:415 (+) Transcript_13540:61-1305(+)